MGYEGADVYSQPEHFGLETVGSVSWDNDSYQFTLTVVWKDKTTGQFFYASDSGCSCPSPFEDFTSRDGLKPIASFQDIYNVLTVKLAEVMEYGGSYTDHAPGEVTELLGKLRKVMK